jgi:spermidine/putrescine transport system permease protein
MIGTLMQELFLRQDNAPLGAALAIVMMAIIAGIVALFLWAVGYARMRERSR